MNLSKRILKLTNRPFCRGIEVSNAINSSFVMGIWKLRVCACFCMRSYARKCARTRNLYFTISMERL